MRLTSTDRSSLATIGVSTLVAVLATAVVVGRAMEPVTMTSTSEIRTPRVERIRVQSPRVRVRHDFRHGRAPMAGAAVAPEVGRRVRGTIATVGPARSEDAPLVYVDGSLVSDLPDLDPNSIDRIEVVRGAAALESFGPEGRNGVIQIYTKSATAQNPGR